MHIAAWTTTNSLQVAREYHTITLLPNGKALVAGGLNDGLSDLPMVQALASAELYDPGNGTWAATGSLNEARTRHTMTLLPNGQVLAAGGYDSSGQTLAPAELYDPSSGTWTTTGSLSEARYEHTTAILSNGNVLTVGGFASMFVTQVLASAELYDPNSGTWTTTGPLNVARTQHTMTLLSDGKALIAGGYDSSGDISASAELYDPSSGTWTTTGSLSEARSNCTMTLLSNGKVLVTGGVNDPLMTQILASAELYDPSSGTWTTTGSLSEARHSHTATLDADGQVIVAGGVDGPSLASTELYDVQSGTWSSFGSLTVARAWHAAMLLITTGAVLIVGGRDPSNNILASAEMR